MSEQVILSSHWTVECVRAGALVWLAEYDNLVVTAGRNKILDAVFKSGLATPTWYVGLVDGASTPTFAAADTMSSHAGWTSNTAFSQTVRPTFVPGTVSAGALDNSASKASFTMNAGATIAGCFLVDSDTKTGTTGTLYAVGTFTGGSQAVVSLDVLNVTVSLTVAAAAASTGFMPIKEEVFGVYHP